MKKSLLTLFAIVCGFVANAQQDTTSLKSTKINGNNELKLNLIYTIAGFPELNYERILKDDMSVGLAVLVGLDNDVDYSFGVIPNFRIYFGNKKANGFFIEGNAAVMSSNRYSYYYYYDGVNDFSYYRDQKQTNFGLGAAAGAKFLTKNGFVGEVYLGAGRLFGNSFFDAYARGGITIGKRF